MEKKQRGRLHRTFDFRKADALFKRVTSAALGSTSAISVVATERIRDALRLRVGKAVESDLFLFGIGRAEDPRVTRVSGCPYWPASRPWPVGKDGVPLRFLAQFCFADSRDLFPKLPGDLLVIFLGGMVDDLGDWFWEERFTRLEWVTLSDAAVLSRLPPGVAPVSKYEWYGVRHRSFDYPRAMKNTRAAAEAQEDEDLFLLPVSNGTKIGGAAINHHGRAPSGQLVCRLGSINAANGVAFPWTNRRAKKKSEFPDTKALSIGDAGGLEIFISKNGRLRIAFGSG